MTIKFYAAAVLLVNSALHAAQTDSPDKTLDNAVKSARDAAEQRLAEPPDPYGKKPDAKKVAAEKKADLADFKGMVKDNLAAVKALFQAAEQSWKAKDYKQAGAFYLSVAQATVLGSEEMVETALLRVNSEMENLAKDHMNAAADAELKRDFMKEIDELSVVLKEFAITKSRADAFRKLANLKTRPEVAGFVEYAQAEQFLADNKLTEALAAFTAIVSNARYEHSIPALKAQRKLDELNKNEDTRARLRGEFTAMADKEAPRLLIAAKNFAANNMPKKAREKLEIVLDKFPGTTYADEAKKLIAELPSK